MKSSTDAYDGIPLAYLITFRTFGTWLHGDARGSVDRDNNRFGAPLIAPNPRWEAYESRMLRRPLVALGPGRRHAVAEAIRETCAIRGWHLYALNVRTNHVHTVVGARADAERVLNALKANATRVMRSSGCWPGRDSPWSRGGSTRYVWTEASLERAISYVLYGQGADLDRVD